MLTSVLSSLVILTLTLNYSLAQELSVQDVQERYCELQDLVGERSLDASFSPSTCYISWGYSLARMTHLSTARVIATHAMANSIKTELAQRLRDSLPERIQELKPYGQRLCQRILNRINTHSNSSLFANQNASCTSTRVNPQACVRDVPNEALARRNKINLIKAIYEVGRLGEIQTSLNLLRTPLTQRAARAHELGIPQAIQNRLDFLNTNYPQAFLLSTFIYPKMMNTNLLRWQGPYERFSLNERDFWLDQNLFDGQPTLDACDTAPIYQDLRSAPVNTYALTPPSCAWARSMFPQNGRGLRGRIENLTDSELESVMEPIYQRWDNFYGDSSENLCRMSDCQLLALSPRLNFQIFQAIPNSHGRQLAREGMCHCPSSLYSNIIPDELSAHLGLASSALSPGCLTGLGCSPSVVAGTASLVIERANAVEALINRPVYQSQLSIHLSLGERITDSNFLGEQLSREEWNISDGLTSAATELPSRFGIRIPTRRHLEVADTVTAAETAVEVAETPRTLQAAVDDIGSSIDRFVQGPAVQNFVRDAEDVIFSFFNFRRSQPSRTTRPIHNGNRR